MMDENDTLWVVSTRQWFDTWLSGQTRHERSPRIRHIGGTLSAMGIVIWPGDRLIYGDTENWAGGMRIAVYEHILIATLAGEKLAREGR